MRNEHQKLKAKALQTLIQWLQMTLYGVKKFIEYILICCLFVTIRQTKRLYCIAQQLTANYGQNHFVANFYGVGISLTSSRQRKRHIKKPLDGRLSINALQTKTNTKRRFWNNGFQDRRFLLTRRQKEVTPCLFILSAPQICQKKPRPRTRILRSTMRNMSKYRL